MSYSSFEDHAPSKYHDHHIEMFRIRDDEHKERDSESEYSEYSDTMRGDEIFMIGIIVVIVVLVAAVIIGRIMDEAHQEQQKAEQKAEQRAAETVQPESRIRLSSGYLLTYLHNGHSYIVYRDFYDGANAIHDPDCVCGNGGNTVDQIKS